MTHTLALESKPAAADAAGGNLLTWILAWSELTAFGALLLAFVVASLLDPAAFTSGRANLHTLLPLTNTLILLCSGWAAAKAATQLIQQRQSLWLVAAAAGGLLFFSLKLLEYRAEGVSLLAEDAFTQLYLLITGFHALHVLFGSLVLGIVALRPNRENVHLITTLWHVIDLVWLVVFPVIYLL